MEKDIEEYRQPWESTEHWNLRKEFLLSHEGKFPENRLLCLAQAFANVEILGCSYPQAVMIQLSALAKEVVSLNTLQEKRKKNCEILFVKGEDDKNKRKNPVNDLGTYTKYSNSRPNLPFQNQHYNSSPQGYQSYNQRMNAAAFFNR
uniref:XRN2-binding (XTBD) domain-containing protein n=1 Tax=Ornithodoros turicata TaxID=34597 RepID=A0A2R5LD75_9ACAR